MGNVKLLDNTRKIERLLHNNDTGKVVFSDICRVMSDVLESNILVISKKGKVLGFGEYREIPILSDLITDQVGTFIDTALNERFLGVLSTNENVILGTLGVIKEEDCSNIGIIAPIEIARSAMIMRDLRLRSEAVIMRMYIFLFFMLSFLLLVIQRP